MSDTFRSPLSRYPNIDESNSLRVNVAGFSKLDTSNEQLQQAIRELVELRQVLLVAESTDLINSFIEVRRLYTEAIRWLGLDHQINDLVVVPPSTDYQSIDPNSVSLFQQFVNSIKSTYLNTPQYYAIQAQIGLEKSSRILQLDLEADKLSDEFKTSLREAQKRLAESTDSDKNELLRQLNDLVSTQKASTQEATTEALNSIKQAKALEIWHEEYKKNIELYELKLDGPRWKALSLRARLTNLRIRTQELKYELIKFKESELSPIDNKSSRPGLRQVMKLLIINIKYLCYLGFVSIRFAILAVVGSVSYLYGKTIRSARGQRIVWFVILGSVLIGQSLIFTSVLLNGKLHDFPIQDFIRSHNLNLLVSNEYVLAKISIFLGFILVPSLGYTFSNRNFRIYSNLLEQYRHRYTVATTLQGVLSNITESEDNKDVRTQLAGVAALAMFEMKNVGHLSKKDGDSVPLMGAIQGIFK